MKAVAMLLIRIAVTLALAYEWLIQGKAGPGNIIAAYVVILALLALVLACSSIDEKTVRKSRLLGKFWNAVDVLFDIAFFCALVWFGHFVLAATWGLACFCSAVYRQRMLDERRKAKEEDEADAFVALVAEIAKR